MEKVVYLVTYDGGESFETEMAGEARYAHENGATVLEIRVVDYCVGRVHIEVRVTVAW